MCTCRKKQVSIYISRLVRDGHVLAIYSVAPSPAVFRFAKCCLLAFVAIVIFSVSVSRGIVGSSIFKCLTRTGKIYVIYRSLYSLVVGYIIRYCCAEWRKLYFELELNADRGFILPVRVSSPLTLDATHPGCALSWYLSYSFVTSRAVVGKSHARGRFVLIFRVLLFPLPGPLLSGETTRMLVFPLFFFVLFPSPSPSFCLRSLQTKSLLCSIRLYAMYVVLYPCMYVQCICSRADDFQQIVFDRSVRIPM